MKDVSNMDLSSLEILRVAVGIGILIYVGYCLINQKVWVRGPIGLESKTFSWGSKEENKTIFMIHVVIGAAIGIFLVVAPFLR